MEHKNEAFIKTVQRIDGKWINEVWVLCSICNKVNHKFMYKYCFKCSKIKKEEYKSNTPRDNNNYNFIDV